MIARALGALNADLALDRMWVFLELADSLSSRASDPKGEIAEVILALPATVDGQTTAHYLADRLAASGVMLRVPFS
mgnify:CR=1 FL=1